MGAQGLNTSRSHSAFELYQFRKPGTTLCLHRSLSFRQLDSHLLKCLAVERACDPDVFYLLIFFQTCARVRVQMTCLLPIVEATLFEYGLRLLDLFFVCAKDGAALLLSV